MTHMMCYFFRVIIFSLFGWVFFLFWLIGRFLFRTTDVTLLELIEKVWELEFLERKQ